jgi:ribosome biogenesis GTPase A
MDSAKLLALIAESRNLLRTGGEPDYQRASKMVLDDFRNGKTGRITLETPPAGGNESE